MIKSNDKKVCIIDYGSGNIRSVYNMFHSLGSSVVVSNEASEIDNASHIVLPGVGAFGAAMSNIESVPSFNAIKYNVLEKKKLFLGICVGMQILAEMGYEYGEHRGLGWIPGVVKVLETKELCLPHVGWNDFKICSDNPLVKGIDVKTDFYYVHSYHFAVSNSDYIVATCEYGMEFISIVNKENIYGVQFHPEKSQKAGEKLLENFLALS